MAYVRARDGAQFGGLGQSLPGGFTELESFVASASSDLKQSQIFKDAMSGLDPSKWPAVLQQANVWADKYLGVDAGTAADKLKRTIFNYSYARLRGALSQLDKNPAARMAVQIAESGIGVAADVKGIVDEFKGDAPVDASGVAAIAKMSHNITMGIGRILSVTGVASDEVLQDVADWSNVVVGCVSGFAAGPQAGAAACAISFASQLIKMFAQKRYKYDGQLALFSPVQSGVAAPQFASIAADAERLAILLRYVYGIKTYSEIADRLSHYKWLDVTRAYPKAFDKTAPTAVDMRCVLVAMASGYKGRAKSKEAYEKTGDELGWALKPKTMGGGGVSENRGYYDRSAKDTYIWDHDVNAKAIQVVADKARRNLGGTTINPALYAFLKTDELLEFFGALTLYELDSSIATVKTYLYPPLPVRFWNQRGQAETWNCRKDFRNTGCGGEYATHCWTTLDRCSVIPTGACKNLIPAVIGGNRCACKEFATIRLMSAFSYLQMMYAWGGAGDPTTLATVDMIAELPAETDPAIVLMHPIDSRQAVRGPQGILVEREPGLLSSGKRTGPSQNGSPGVWMDRLANDMRSRAAFVKGIADKASAVAKTDHAIVRLADEATLQQILMQTKVAPTATAAASMTAAAMKKMLEATGALSTIQAEQKKCFDAGGEWFDGGAQCDYGVGGKLQNCRAPAPGYTGRKHTCVPKGTPGAKSTITTSMPLTAEKKAPGVGTVLAVAGAGLLLLRLLKS